MHKKSFVLIGAFAVMVGSCFAGAQSGQATSGDKNFVKDAIEGGNAEIELGQLAMQKGNSDDVRQFGKKMMDDHNELGVQMKSVASQIGVDAPKMIPPSDKALEMKLKMLNGDGFDETYIKAMIKDHRQDLADFKKEVDGGSSPAVKDAASQGTQVISSHLEMIEQIAQAHHIAEAQSASGQ